MVVAASRWRGHIEIGHTATMNDAATIGRADQLATLRAGKDLLDRWFASPLAIPEVAARVGYSPHHFSRAFRRAYGQSPGRYLAQRRIERAQDLLRNSDLTVTEICMMVGFSSLGTFSATFKRAIGLAPTTYRQREQQVRDDRAVVPGCVLLMKPTPELPPER